MSRQNTLSMFSVDKEWIDFLHRIKWTFVILIVLGHISAYRGLIILLTEAKWQTIFVCYILCEYYSNLLIAIF